MGPVWPAQALVPPLVAPERAGEARDLAVVRRGKVRWFFCISVVSRNIEVDCGLVCLEFRGTFTSVPHAHGSPLWAVSARGPRLA